MQESKKQEWKIQDKTSGVENAGKENKGQNNTGGKCGKRKIKDKKAEVEKEGNGK